MKIKKLYAVYFSATGTTEKIVRRIADGAGAVLGLAAETVDFTLPAARKEHYSFEEGDLVIFGVPVYAGRVPNLLLPFVQSGFSGGGALAVPVVLYGNRNYDDGLIELRNTLEADGFHTVAGAAFIGEHSFSYTLAAHRPDEQDLAVADRFARQLAEKAAALPAAPSEPAYVKGCDPIRPYYTPRDRKGNPVNILKVKPKTSDACVKCGLCVKKCPMGAIDPADPSNVPGICIKCGACVKKCPKGAKYYDDEKYLYHQHELEEGFARRAEPETFLG